MYLSHLHLHCWTSKFPCIALNEGADPLLNESLAFTSIMEQIHSGLSM